MIDRVEIQRILSNLFEREEKVKQRAYRREEGVKVEVQKELTEVHKVDYEDINKKVERIREMLEKGVYDVSPEKILIGLEKYLLSK